MKYEIIADLYRYVPYKKATEYARFMEIDGRGVRLDFERRDEDENITGEQLNLLMDELVKCDMDRGRLEKIPQHPVDPDIVRRWRDKGFIDR